MNIQRRKEVKEVKKSTIISLVVAIGLLISGGVYAWWPGGNYGMGYGASENVETMKKFQKETLGLRDELMIKQLELQNEYSKPQPDYNRIGTLRKEIVDIQTKIQASADKYGLPAWGSGYGKGHGMMSRDMMGYGMMMDMCSMMDW